MFPEYAYSQAKQRILDRKSHSISSKFARISAEVEPGPSDATIARSAATDSVRLTNHRGGGGEKEEEVDDEEEVEA